MIRVYPQFGLGFVVVAMPCGCWRLVVSLAVFTGSWSVTRWCQNRNAAPINFGDPVARGDFAAEVAERAGLRISPEMRQWSRDLQAAFDLPGEQRLAALTALFDRIPGRSATKLADEAQHDEREIRS